jgi:ADP-heptose:LPS heptosyltransferase
LRVNHCHEKWREIRAAANPESLASLSNCTATSFITSYFQNKEYEAGYIHLLCEMATSFECDKLNKLASSALFGIVIEGLCDDFEDPQVETYNKLMSQIVTFLRHHPKGNQLDVELNSFQLQTQEQLFNRAESIRLSSNKPISDKFKPKKVLILSRVTIGADIAITSVVCQRVATHFPNSTISIIGNPKLDQVFSIESGISIHALSYARRGALLERFLVWVELITEIRKELAGLEESEYLVLDPDSRLSQLGVLPIVPSENYRFFNSRGSAHNAINASMSQLTNLWLDKLFVRTEFVYPKVWVSGNCLEIAEKFRKTIRNSESPNLISINFGVGGNNRKRIPDNFETQLVLRLLENYDNRIVLDLGFGDEEGLRNNTILEGAANAGISSQTLEFEELENVSSSTRLIGVKCSIRQVAALITCCDEFIGYDSACQHVSTAVGIRTYTIFADANSETFIQRWRACGKNVSEIVCVDTFDISPDEREVKASETIEKLMVLRQG